MRIGAKYIPAQSRQTPQKMKQNCTSTGLTAKCQQVNCPL